MIASLFPHEILYKECKRILCICLTYPLSRVIMYYRAGY
nr:MAG TPA: Protein of unknown function (DUF3793) [Caudoviricetes sp.]